MQAGGETLLSALHWLLGHKPRNAWILIGMKLSSEAL